MTGGGAPPHEDIHVHNWTVEANLPRKLPERVVFWDETLRDGEQTPGVYYTLDEKVKLAKKLDEIGVDILNCGIPAISPNEVAAVKAIAKEGLRASVLGACRTVQSDIDACLKADVDEVSPFIAISDVHLKYKLKKTREEAIAMAVASVEYAKAHGLKTTIVTEDTVRADLDVVAKLYNACIDAGADRALFCDTVGVMTPAATRWWFSEIKKRVNNKAEFGFHNHNDYGLGTANALAAIEEGIPVINCTINGIGERAGNVAFEQVVMALRDLYKVKTNIKVDKLMALSRDVEEATGIPVGLTQPVVGYNAFTHESGIHTDGVIKNAATYEPIQAEDLGRERRFVFGKHTGTTAVADRLEKNGITGISKEQQLDIANRIKAHTEGQSKGAVKQFVEQYRHWDVQHNGVDDPTFWRIVKDVTGKSPPPGVAERKFRW
ncbi:MAG TPA: 2-isopropylmalate synthase [Candidatus Thermoplasmatota archaeon]|nr:2-isopropylmalate synthase [Candidatus Thermoplasmatota archaeon]